MDPALARLHIILAAAVVVLVTVAVEWLCKGLWTPTYFRFGILVFQRQVRLPHDRAFTADILEREYPGLLRRQVRPGHDRSFMATLLEQQFGRELPRMLFRRLDEHHIAFRTGWYASGDRGTVHALFGGIMYGLLSRSAGVVTVRGYLSWSVLAQLLLSPIVVITMLMSGDALAILPSFLALFSLWLFCFWLSYGGESRRYESVAQLLESAGPSGRGQAFDVVIAPGEIQASVRYGGQHGYSYEGRGVLVTEADSDESASRSNLVLLENMQPLGPAHSKHADIENLGRGRFSHWHDGIRRYLFFSASDNSDPRTNGRSYMVAIGKGRSSN